VWTERTIGRALQRQVFDSKVLVVDNCYASGFEADLLIVEPGLRMIDVEIKISRPDLKADAGKDKWIDFQAGQSGVARSERPRKLWPHRVWKHYYAMPASIWNDELYSCLGSPKSGVLLLSEVYGEVTIRVQRRAVPNRESKRLTAPEILDVARLASLRMWDAYEGRRRKVEV